MAQVFISYSRKDLDFVQQLAADLKNAGFEVWYDVAGIRGGSKWRTEIEKGLSSSQFALVVLSPDSTASEWVEREFLFASDLNLKIIPLYYRECKLPLNYLDMNYIDVRGNKYREKFSEILSAMDPSRIPSPPLHKKSFWEEIKKKLPVISAVLFVIGMVIGAVFLLYRGATGPGGQLQTEIPMTATQTIEVTQTPPFSAGTATPQVVVFQWIIEDDRAVIELEQEYWEKYEADTSPAGLYLRSDNINAFGDFLVLNSDGTFTLDANGTVKTGTWKIDGDQLTLMFP
jgi:hypothetical protein